MSRRSPPAESSSPQGPKGRYPLRPTEGYIASLADLGEPSATVRSRLTARMAEFSRDWEQTGVSFQELGSTYDFKRVAGKQCAQFNMYQIRFANIRVFLTLADPHRVAYILEAHRKQGTPQQNRAIQRCVQRARRIWQESPS